MVQENATKASTEQGTERATKSQADKLCEIAGGVHLFHTPDGDAYADLPIDGGIETVPVKSTRFKMWLLTRYDDTYGGCASNNAMADARNTLEARAVMRGEEREVFIRVGWQDDMLYLDMCDPARRVIRIKPVEGWDIIPASEAPVRFRRTADMLASPLPEPQRGGDVRDLFRHINVTDADAQMLVVAFLLNMLLPNGPYAGLEVLGEQGSAKSCAARLIRAIVDPTDNPATGEPTTADNLALQSRENWVPAFDNLRSVKDWLSDALCRLATGGGYNKKTLYTDVDLTIIKAKRPFIITSITDAITQADLLDRTLVVRLPVIPDEERRDEATVNAAYELDRPYILGALLDAAAWALGCWEDLKLDKLLRMADLAKWVTAAEPQLDIVPGTFIRTLALNKTDAYQATIDSNPVAVSVVAFVAEMTSWEGTPTELYEMLKRGARDGMTNRLPFGWPANAQAMSNKLKEAAPALRTRYGWTR
jgi:hypothetical protein